MVLKGHGRFYLQERDQLVRRARKLRRVFKHSHESTKIVAVVHKWREIVDYNIELSFDEWREAVTACDTLHTANLQYALQESKIETLVVAISVIDSLLDMLFEFREHISDFGLVALFESRRYFNSQLEQAGEVQFGDDAACAEFYFEKAYKIFANFSKADPRRIYWLRRMIYALSAKRRLDEMNHLIVEVETVRRNRDSVPKMSDDDWRKSDMELEKVKRCLRFDESVLGLQADMFLLP